MAARWMVAAVVLAVSCAPRPEPVMDAGPGSPPELGSSLNVRVVEDTVVLEIHITNVASSPITLEFPSSQRYDFAVSTAEGESVWRWSAARSFMQVLGSEELQPGESRRYSETWVGSGEGREYVATGWVVSTSYPVELRTTFRVPEE
ncbi:MAG TPA: BsuPI-related putative proteinase inhibitor [Longimicrobiales bacterium]|nr:BsuPI-related putative proteinase inhibitor [Longimicrobiales bacterium]